MNKVKYTLAILLSVLIVVLCALLPRLVSAAGDERTLGNPGSRWMQAVQFEIHKNMPSLGKLSMFSKETGTVEIPENKASMTMQQVHDSLTSALKPYIDAGLMADYDEWQLTMQPHLIQSEDASSIFWSVSLICDAEGLYTIDAVIDDETGQLLGILVSDQQFRGSALRSEYLYTFADLYFTGIGIADYDYAESDALQDLEGSVNAVRYSFGDVVYGEVHVDLFVHEYGFYIEVPQMEVAAYEGK